MSNDNKPKREMAISAIRFHALVDIGSRAEEGWQAIGGNDTIRKTRVQDMGNHLLFTYEAGDVYQEIEVPKANVASIKRIPRDKLESLRKQGAL